MTRDFSTEHPPTRRWGAGWYPDHDNGGERWWDGQEWDRSRWRPPADGDARVPGDPGDGAGPAEAPSPST